MADYSGIEAIKAKPETSDYKVVVRRSPRSMIGLAIVLFGAVLLVIAFNIMFHDYHPVLPFLGEVSPRWFALIPLGIAVEMLRRLHDDHYIFDAKRVTNRSGRYSLRFSMPVIKYIDIRGVSVAQGLIGRIFDFGSVELGTSAQDSNELTIAGVAHPNELAGIIEALRAHRKAVINRENAEANRPHEEGWD